MDKFCCFNKANNANNNSADGTTEPSGEPRHQQMGETAHWPHGLAGACCVDQPRLVLFPGCHDHTEMTIINDRDDRQEGKKKQKQLNKLKEANLKVHVVQDSVDKSSVNGAAKSTNNKKKNQKVMMTQHTRPPVTFRATRNHSTT